MAELTAVARGWAGHRFELRSDGVPVGVLRLSLFGRSARLEGTAESFTMTRQGFMGGVHFLQLGQQTIARVEKTALVRNVFELHLGEAQLAMRRIGFTGRIFAITDQNGREVGRAVRQRGFRLNATLTLAGDWPMPLLAFLLWIPLRVWTGERAAGA